MVRIELGNQAVTTTFRAAAPVGDGEMVALTAPNGVAPADDTLVQACIGVADAAAAVDEEVRVIIMGKVPVVADGPIDPGQPVVPAPAAGRVVAEAAQAGSHSHSVSDHTHPIADHTHTMPDHQHQAFTSDGTDTNPGAHQGVVEGDGGGTSLSVGVDAAAQGEVGVATSSEDPGDTNAGGSGSTDAGGSGATDAADATTQNARSVGIAVGTAGGAGETLLVLVGAKAG